MTKSTITRERIQRIIRAIDSEAYDEEEIREWLSSDEIMELARMALSAMDSEHYTDDELSNLLWYSQEATCHSDPNYYCEFQRLATPGFIASIIRELQERRKADSEPVAWLLSGGGAKNVVCFDSGNAYADPLREVTPLYRHAQPAPVVPDEVEHVAAVLELIGSFEAADIDSDTVDLRFEIDDVDTGSDASITEYAARGAAIIRMLAGNSPAIPDGYVMVPKEMTDEIGEAIAMQANCCGGIALDIYDAMLAAAPQSPGSEPATVPGKWIPVSERMPEDEQEVLTINRMGHCFVSFFDKHSGLFFDRIDAPAACCIEHVLVTHWMSLPAAPQEVNHG